MAPRYGNGTIIGCKAFNSDVTGTDNQAIAVRNETAGGQFVVSGLTIIGADNSHRWAADFGGDSTAADISGVYTNRVVTTT
jgi:hypothetical protein